MSTVRRLAIAILLAFGLSLLLAAPAAAHDPGPKDKLGEVKVCKVLKDTHLGKGDRVTFDFVVRERTRDGDRVRKTVSFTFNKHNQDLKQCDKVEVPKGAYVVREKIPYGYKLNNIEVTGKDCYYRDRNDYDARIQVDVQKNEKCTVTFTNKKQG